MSPGTERPRPRPGAAAAIACPRTRRGEPNGIPVPCVPSNAHRKGTDISRTEMSHEGAISYRSGAWRGRVVAESGLPVDRAPRANRGGPTPRPASARICRIPLSTRIPHPAGSSGTVRGRESGAISVESTSKSAAAGGVSLSTRKPSLCEQILGAFTGCGETRSRGDGLAPTTGSLNERRC